MLKNYLKIAVRNLLKHKAYSFINIAGLALGMTCCLLILLYVQHELSYDRFHRQADRIYRIFWQSGNPQTRTPHPMAQAMARDFAEIESAVSLSPIWGPGLTRPQFSVRYGDKRFEEREVFSADSTFFEVFSFRLIKGDPRTALRSPASLVITERMAEKYFGEEEPMGKVLTVNNSVDLKVTGVMENVPAHSHFHFDFLISYVLLKMRETGSYYEWEDFGHYNYVKLAPNADPEMLEAKIPEWFLSYNDWPADDVEELKDGRVAFRLQPITDIHLHSHLKWELEPNSDVAYVWLFSAIAIFVLLIACISFMNLSTARSATRAREVGVRKVLGAFRTQLLGQFLGESILLSVMALLLTLAAVELLLPFFNSLSGRNLAVDYRNGGRLILGMCGMALLVGIISGSYPAFFLFALQPVKTLKDAMRFGASSARFRQILVVSQFAISIALIASTFIVAAQLEFLKNKNLGFDKAQVVVVPIKSDAMRRNDEAVKAELLRTPSVVGVTAVSNVPGGRFNQNEIYWQAAENEQDVSQVRVDYDFFKTLGIEMAQGRSFSRAMATDSAAAFILNETAVRLYDWDTAVGKEITWLDDDDTRRGLIIGVAKDFHFQSLHRSIEPLIFHVLPEGFNYFLIKMDSHDLPNTLAEVEKKWKAFEPDRAFEYSFLDEDFAALYNAEESMQGVVGNFSLLAILIACLGLFGLASFTMQQRTKEIGVRKVLGASVTSIVGLLLKEFVKLIVMAMLIASPIAYYTMSRWLHDFAYRIEIGVLTFALAGGLALAIALLTVSAQAIKTALANPVEVLRYE
jgi:putative ABC transport system permease protein